MTDTDLIVIPKETALTIFSADDGLEPFMQKIRAEIDAFVPDISTKKGRDAVASIAHKVAKSKTYLDGVGKDLVAELKELPKKIDASRKTMRDTLDVWKDEVRLPLTEWEQAEESRINLIKSRLSQLEMYRNTAGLNSIQIEESIHSLEAIAIDDSWQEFGNEAAHAKDAVLSLMRTNFAIVVNYEAEQCELARLRAEAELRAQQDRDAQIAREAAERATREAVERAQRERDAEALRTAQVRAETERRELEQRLLLERAERERADALLAAERAQKDAERRAQEAVEAEQRRVAAEQLRLNNEAKAREKDRTHKAAINKAALTAFMDGGLSEECAKVAVTLIAKRSIPAVTIAY